MKSDCDVKSCWVRLAEAQVSTSLLPRKQQKRSSNDSSRVERMKFQFEMKRKYLNIFAEFLKSHHVFPGEKFMKMKKTSILRNDCSFPTSSEVYKIYLLRLRLNSNLSVLDISRRRRALHTIADGAESLSSVIILEFKGGSAWREGEIKL